MNQLKFDLFLRKTDVLLTPNNHWFFILFNVFFKIYRAISIYVCFEVPCYFEVHIPVFGAFIYQKFERIRDRIYICAYICRALRYAYSFLMCLSPF